MREEKLEKLLNELADATAEQPRPGLAEDIRRRIPQQLSPHRGRMDTINIIIDLRISRLAAAAAIIITMILLANFLGGRDLTGDDVYQDSKLLVRYFLVSDKVGRGSLSAGRSRYEYLVGKGKDAVYYGDVIDPADGNAVLMQWKLSDGGYRVIFADLREEIISAEELIKLQAQMLQKKAK